MFVFMLYSNLDYSEFGRSLMKLTSSYRRLDLPFGRKCLSYTPSKSIWYKLLDILVHKLLTIKS